jgi:DNA-binding response OmpR family regulator
MEDFFTLLWIGNRHQVNGLATRLLLANYRLIIVEDVASALREIGSQDISLIIMENETSCVKGELAAVRLKSAAPEVPILLLCDPLDSGTPQVFFVNLILGSNVSPELLFRAIETLVPRRAKLKKTGTKD